MKYRAFLGAMALLFAGIFIYADPIPGPFTPYGVYLIGMIVLIGCAFVVGTRRIGQGMSGTARIICERTGREVSYSLPITWEVKPKPSGEAWLLCHGCTIGDCADRQKRVGILHENPPSVCGQQG